MSAVNALTSAGASVRSLARRRIVAPPSAELLAAAALTVGFLAVTAWWLKHDSRVPDFDNGKHLGNSFYYYDLLHQGLLEPFKVFTTYPPLLHLVGALGVAVGGVGVRGPIMVENVVFVPLLAAGCYGAGTVAAEGRRLGGLLAVVFALGTPMVVSQLHVMMLDAPEAAMVAMTVWLLLASDRLGRPGIAAAAGLFAGLGLLVKPTFPLFIAGLLLVQLTRGGWRNWRGLAAFAVVAAVVAAPWYIDHYHDLRGLTTGALTFSTPDAGAGHNPDSTTPPRWSMQNATWYLWAALNHQILLPLALLFGAGTAAALIGYLRRRRRSDLTLELVAGVTVGYVASTLAISLHDVRYTLPALVYVAVLGTRWIALAPRRWQLAGAAAVGVVALVNFVAVSFGPGHRVRYELPGAVHSELGRRQVTLYSPEGYLVGRPERGGRVLELMLAAKEDGKQLVGFNFDDGRFFNSSGLRTFAHIANLPATVGPHDLLVQPAGFYLVAKPIGPGWRDPCSKLTDGSGVFGLLPNRRLPLDAWPHYCPPGFGPA